MTSAPEPASGGTDLLRFGIFELDTEAGRLYKDGRFVRLQPKPFKLLCLLAESGGKLVTREESVPEEDPDDAIFGRRPTASSTNCCGCTSRI